MKPMPVVLLLAMAGLAGCLAHHVEQPALDDPTRDLLRAGTIVYVDEGSLYRARGDGSDRKRILATGEVGPGGRVITAALSADGRRAACLSLQSIDVASGSGSHLTLHLLELTGAGGRESHRVSLRAIVQPDAEGRHPIALIAPGMAWSSDGGRLALGLAPATGTGRVLVFDSEGQPLADLDLAAPGLSALSSVSWGREGSWLAVGLLRQIDPEAAAEPVVAAVQVPPGAASATAGAPVTLRVLARGAYPALSPDGSRIAVVSLREGLSDLALLDDQGSEMTRFIRPAGKALNHPFWSGDGRFLYYYSLASTGPLGLVEVTILRCLDLRTRQVHDLARLS